MVAGFLDAITKMGRLKYQNDDDNFDKLHRRYTVLMLMLFTVIVSTKQYVGDPIACWTPAQFTGAHVEYANYMCWVSNSYHINMNERTPSRNEERVNIVPYYQWVPFILPCMAVFFCLPSMLWRSCLLKSGIDISSVVRTVETMEDIDQDSRFETIFYIARYIHKILYAQISLKSRKDERVTQTMNLFWMSSICSKRGNYLLMMYFVVKFLYVLNSAIHLYFLKFIIGESFKTLGYDLIMNIINGDEWKIHEKFPRVTLCDFIVRNLADNNHQHTVQCVLPVNIFNEKIFITIWFWYTFIFLSTNFSIILWIWYFLPWSKKQFIRKNLRLTRSIGKSDTIIFNSFVNRYLRQDGILIIRIISKNTNNIITAEIIAALWEQFKKTHEDGIFV